MEQSATRKVDHLDANSNTTSSLVDVKEQISRRGVFVQIYKASY